MSELSIDVVSDVICPWCYIGKRRLEKALSIVNLSTEVRWLPFQLNPGMPHGGMPRSEYRTAKFGSAERAKSLDARVAAEGAGEGISFAFDRIQRTPNTAAAHRLIALAQKQGAGAQIVDALFKAYFEEARDIGDAGVLGEVAASLGVRGWPQAGDAAEVAALEDKMRGQGISAVPTFVFNRRLGVSGAHPPETLAVAMREALAK